MVTQIKALLEEMQKFSGDNMIRMCALRPMNRKQFVSSLRSIRNKIDDILNILE